MSAFGTTDPAAGEASSKPTITLSEREKELYIIAMMYCNKAGPAKIDWEKFKEFGGFNTVKTAQNTWSKMKQKFPAEESDDAGEGPAKSTPKKKTPVKRPKPTKSQPTVGEEDDSEAEATPAKKLRKKAGKKVVAGPDPEADPEAEGEAEEE